MKYNFFSFFCFFNKFYSFFSFSIQILFSIFMKEHIHILNEVIIIWNANFRMQKQSHHKLRNNGFFNFIFLFLNLWDKLTAFWSFQLFKYCFSQILFQIQLFLLFLLNYWRGCLLFLLRWFSILPKILIIFQHLLFSIVLTMMCMMMSQLIVLIIIAILAILILYFHVLFFNVFNSVNGIRKLTRSCFSHFQLFHQNWVRTYHLLCQTFMFWESLRWWILNLYFIFMIKSVQIRTIRNILTLYFL